MLRRDKGFLDRHQAEAVRSYDELIKLVLKQIPWSNISEIAELGSKLKRRWPEGSLASGKLERKTVREHLLLRKET